jgi:alpha-1,4-digalacturonate transport system permease protein
MAQSQLSPRGSAKQSTGDLLFKPFAWLLGLADVVFTPLQKLIGAKRMAYIFVLPNLLIFGVFILLPALLNFYYSFTSGQSILLQNREFVGAANLQTLFACENYLNPSTCSQDLFWRGVANTSMFVVGEVTLTVLLSLVTALALNRKIAGRGFFRSVFFYPVLLSPVVVALIWKWILQLDSGLLNAALVRIGLEKVPWLLEPNWARLWVILVSVWAHMGIYTLILLAGLQAIPGELYEASALDGANLWQSFRSITLPLLMPTMTVVLVLSVIRAVQVFDVVFVLTNGGPGTATLYIVQYIFRTGFELRQFGLAASASLVLAVVLMILTLGQLALSRSRNAA